MQDAIHDVNFSFNLTLGGKPQLLVKEEKFQKILKIGGGAGWGC